MINLWLRLSFLWMILNYNDNIIILLLKNNELNILLDIDKIEEINKNYYINNIYINSYFVNIITIYDYF